MTEELKLCEHNNYHCFRCEVKLLKFTIDELQQQQKQLIEALKWYSNEENYLLYAKAPLSPVERDFGYLAKRTLQQIQGKDE